MRSPTIPLRFDHLRERRILWLIAGAIVAPALVCLAIAAHFWSTAGRLATYKPAEPSRLYAAPLVLRPGGPADRAALVADLGSLGYRRTAGAPHAGEMRVADDELEIGLRREAVVEVEHAARATRRLSVGLHDGRVGELRADGDTLLGEAAVTLGRPLLFTYYDAELRESRPVRLAELPRHVVAAVLAAEDGGYFRHSGVAPVGIARAAWEDVRSREVRQGGSTITQQLVKNLFLGTQRTLGRKLREAVLAMLVEARFGKERVLEAYLNEIYWGSAGGANLHGLGAASLAYFGKEPRELTLAEAATLAGMIQSPAGYSPLADPAAARQRRDWVLERMAARRFVSRQEAEAARAEALAVHPLPLAGRRAPWFAVAMAAEARQRFDVERLGGTGYQLLSTLSSTDQAIAEQEVRSGLRQLERTVEGSRGVGLEASLVSLEPESGRIRAWVGGRDWRRSEFDRVTQARRQAGSAFKPIVYAAALADGRLTPWETLQDSPILVKSGGREWRPRNNDGYFHGDVTPAEALELSLNVPAVRVGMRAGLPRVVETAHAMGIASPLPEVPSLALGTCEVTSLELATAYATLAADGRRPTPWGLEGVVDADGETLLGPAPPSAVRVLPAESAYEVTAMLRGVLDRGTGIAARSYGVHGALAGKTGTTDDRRDGWFAGYSGDRVTVVWVGYDDNSATRLSGSRAALPVWSRFTARAEPAGGWAPLEAPPGFMTVDVDPTTGLLATPFCPRRVRQELPSWRVPLRRCDVHEPQQQLAYWESPPPDAANTGLAEFITRSGAGLRTPGRSPGQVTSVVGEGSDVRLDHGGK
ncbi:MAG TPA: PBP1A family penicillin-binding protein [Thermoanaerobaculia bacterium]|jgi:penicillin-binding protein 1B|nr:PBP1A family penicillin-binding protein [Thermoanaerobaculia bacterium]